MLGAEIAARDIPATPDAKIGGVWRDTFALSDGRLGLDVAGRGLRAASVMGRLRKAVRAYAIEPGSTVELVRRLGRFLDRNDMVTLVYPMLDPIERTAAYTNAAMADWRYTSMTNDCMKSLQRSVRPATTAIEHACGGSDAEFSVEAVWDADCVEIVIRDHGQWRPPRPRRGSHGSNLMNALMDRVEIQRRAGGTTVRLHRRCAGVHT